jgi:hypothetical protein
MQPTEAVLAKQRAASSVGSHSCSPRGLSQGQFQTADSSKCAPLLDQLLLFSQHTYLLLTSLINARLVAENKISESSTNKLGVFEPGLLRSTSTLSLN